MRKVNITKKSSIIFLNLDVQLEINRQPQRGLFSNGAYCWNMHLLAFTVLRVF